MSKAYIALIAAFAAALTEGVACRSHSDEEWITIPGKPSTVPSLTFAEYFAEISLAPGQTAPMPGRPGVEVTALEVDDVGQRVRLGLRGSPTEGWTTGWVGGGESVAFAPGLVGRAGLGVKNIGKGSVILIERWGGVVHEPSTSPSSHGPE